MNPKAVTKTSLMAALAVATVPGAAPRSGKALSPSEDGLIIHQRMVNTKYGIYSPLHGRKRIITRNKEGIEAVSFDTSAEINQDLPTTGNRVIYWPKENVNALITDGWKAVQTTIAQDYLSFRGPGERNPANHCTVEGRLGSWTESFVGYENLKGLSVAHVLRAKSYKDTDQVEWKVDAYFWEEARCLEVQRINTHYDYNQNWIVSLVDGWEMESFENGTFDRAAFEIPADYREGSMQEFEREAQAKLRRPDYTSKIQDPYSTIKAKRPPIRTQQ